jgi:hypothetical protein
LIAEVFDVVGVIRWQQWKPGLKVREVAGFGNRYSTLNF